MLFLARCAILTKAKQRKRRKEYQGVNKMQEGRVAAAKKKQKEEKKEKSRDSYASMLSAIKHFLNLSEHITLSQLLSIA